MASMYCEGNFVLKCAQTETLQLHLMSVPQLRSSGPLFVIVGPVLMSLSSLQTCEILQVSII